MNNKIKSIIDEIIEIKELMDIARNASYKGKHAEYVEISLKEELKLASSDLNNTISLLEELLKEIK